ncbi:uncharacterized protein [Watersipora subatra]|uniref:uncharacterized protein n=1 Tax=Watersipora subatra TaxID=2589382 RepID=UPI00355C15E3
MDDSKPFTLEYVRLFMLEKGGICTNHDLVARFKPYLSHPVRKVENRNKLKDFVQLLATVETRNGEKVLVLKKRYLGQGCFNMLQNQDQRSQTELQPGGGLVTIPEVFTSPEPTPEAPVRPTRSRKREAPEPPRNVEATAQAVPSDSASSVSSLTESKPSESKNSPSELDFYSSMVGKRSSNLTPELDRKISGSASDVGPIVPPPAEYAKADVQTSSSSMESSSVSTNALAAADSTMPKVMRAHSPKIGKERAPLTDVPSTPAGLNSETLNKTPTSAKERIKHFDQISADQPAVPSNSTASRRNNKENYRHTQHNPDADYDGGFVMVSLDSKEKEWMLRSAACDYNAMNRLLKEQPDLAHRRDFINGMDMKDIDPFDK